MSIIWKWANVNPQEVKNKKYDFITRIRSAEHFNFKHYSIEKGNLKKNMIFNLKLYDNGDQNIQFYTVSLFSF